jgi:DNA-binding NarL/FixJ family response regulator
VTRILLVDDQQLIRQGLKLVLSAHPDLEVVGELDDGADVVATAEALAPDVVCMDVRMPGVDGITATAELVARGGPPVCILTTFGDQDVLWGAVEAGAAGFELKSATPENLVEAIRTVARGGHWIDGSLLGDLVESFRRIVLPQQRGAATLEELTARELDVLRAMARGASNGEIADQLYVAETTVKTHVGAIFSKLGVRDRAAAIVYAYDSGVVTPRHQG